MLGIGEMNDDWWVSSKYYIFSLPQVIIICRLLSRQCTTLKNLPSSIVVILDAKWRNVAYGISAILLIVFYSLSPFSWYKCYKGCDEKNSPPAWIVRYIGFGTVLNVLYCIAMKTKAAYKIFCESVE